MATPPMLRQPGFPRAVASPRPDGVVAITVLLLALCAIGMMVAAILAVYDYATPAVEGPLAAGLAAVFGAVVLLNVAAPAARHFRRR